MSGILYPILILTLFLIVQILTLMASRKAILDKNKQQLLDSVNASNKIYNNEELSILVSELQTANQNLNDKLATLDNKYNATVTELKNYNASVPIGEYNLYTGDYFTKSTSYVTFHVTYTPFVRLQEKFDYKQSGKYKICFEYTTDSYSPDYAYIKLTDYHTGSKVFEYQTGLWGNTTSASSVDCKELPNSFISEQHYNIQTRVTGNHGITIYRVFLLVY